MKNSLLLILLLLPWFTGCFGEEQDVAPVIEKNPTSQDSNKTTDSEEGYLQVLGEKYPQNVISNRMQKNFARFSNQSDKSRMHLFPSAGIEVYKPDNLEPADRFTGFICSEDGGNAATLVVSTNPFPMENYASEIVSDAIRSEKVKILFNKDLEIDGRRGEFYFTTEPLLNFQLAKYTLVFGNEEFCWIITCSFNANQEEKYAEDLLTAILNLKVSDQPRLPPGNDVDFKMVPDQLVLTDGFVDKLVYTRTGVFPADDPKEPVFQAAKTVVGFEKSNRKQLAERLISPSPLFAIDFISSRNEVETDGLKGYEFVAVGEDMIAKEPIWLYTVILFEGDFAYLFHGWVSSDVTDNYIKEFRTLAQSFKRRKTETNN